MLTPPPWPGPDESQARRPLAALDGMFDDHHGELAALLLDQITALDGKITRRHARPSL
jgi:hypothetical protein